MEAFIISQLRKGGEFPGLHKVACPGLVSAQVALPAHTGYLLEVFTEHDEAVAALRKITEAIGPFYSIVPINIEVGVSYGLGKESSAN